MNGSAEDPAACARQLGPRERKRQDTRRRISTAALELATVHGLDGVTIERISDRAGISKRTFSNYFDGKDDALLITGLELSEDMLAAHAAFYSDVDVIESIIGLLFLSSGPVLAEDADTRSRAALLRQYPHLRIRQMALLARMTDSFIAAATRIVAADPRWADADQDGTAQMLVSLGFGAMQYTAAPAMAGDAFASIDDLEKDCVALVRRIVERLG